MLCVQVDGGQHEYYIKPDENKMYDDLFMGFDGKCIFVKYNKDKHIYKYKKHLRIHV